MKAEKISVEEASKILHISPDSIRCSMLIGDLPIGHVRKSKTGKSNIFDIYRHLCMRYIGLEEEAQKCDSAQKGGEL